MDRCRSVSTGAGGSSAFPATSFAPLDLLEPFAQRCRKLGLDLEARQRAEIAAGRFGTYLSPDLGAEVVLRLSGHTCHFGSRSLWDQHRPAALVPADDPCRSIIPPAR